MPLAGAMVPGAAWSRNIHKNGCKCDSQVKGTYQVSDVLEDGSVLVEHSSVVQHQSGHIALGVDLVKVSSRCSQVSSNVNLLGLDVDFGSESSNEGCSAARRGSVVKLGHFRRLWL